MIIEALETGKAEWNPPALPATMKEVIDATKRSARNVRALGGAAGRKWDGSLEFFGNQRPASPMAWSFLFDIVHHRGQITTYLRPMGSTVPQIYGPRATSREGGRGKGIAGWGNSAAKRRSLPPSRVPPSPPLLRSHLTRGIVSYGLPI